MSGVIINAQEFRGTIISSVIKTKDLLEVGSKFCKRRKIIPMGKTKKEKGMN